MGQDQDDVTLLPYTAAQKKLLGQSIPRINQIMLQAISPGTTSIAEKMIGDLLRQRHNIMPGQEDTFSIRNMTDIAEAAEQTSLIMTLLLGSIAAVSLVVGGIGIMNIMLVSVTERTREIGLRMAVGAKGQDVLWQFLVEAMALSLAGGMVGVGLGFAIAEGLTQFLQWPTSVSSNAVAVSVGFAALIGIVFGFYPAWKGAQLDPIESLRFE